MGKLVIVLALAHQIGDVELVGDPLFWLHGARSTAVAKGLPIGAVNDFLRAAANDITAHGYFGEPSSKPDGQVSPPRRVDGENIGTVGRREPMDELERRSEAVNARVRERPSA